MISQRLTCLSRTRAAALFALSLVSLLSVVTPNPAHAGSKPTTLAWRPGWLPGDPATSDLSLAPRLWEIRAARGTARNAGLFIALDPVTRLPVAPSDEQKRAFAAQQERDAQLAPTRPLSVEKLPGGGEIIHLNGQFQVYSIARRDAKGRIVTDCAPDPTSARKLMTEPAPSKTVWEEK